MANTDEMHNDDSGPGRDTGPLLLRDGSQVVLSPTTDADEGALQGFLESLCPDARRLRFFSSAIDLRRAAHQAADAHGGGYGLLARDGMGTVVGHAAYAPLTTARAEVAVEVADRLHGCGLGTALVAALAEHAERRGMTHFRAEVLSENEPMLDVFRDAFDARVICREDPEEQVEFPTSGWRLARERFASEPAAVAENV